MTTYIPRAKEIIHKLLEKIGRDNRKYRNPQGLSMITLNDLQKREDDFRIEEKNQQNSVTLASSLARASTLYDKLDSKSGGFFRQVTVQLYHYYAEYSYIL